MAGICVIKARFTGRSALNFVGQCVGLGDAFDVVITALPVYKSGAHCVAGSEGDERRQERILHPQGLRGDAGQPGQGLQIRAGTGGADAAGSPAAQPGYKREVRKFTVPDIRVTNDALVLQVDFELTVK